MEDLVLSCLESRVEENRNLYARFLVGPFFKGDALTVATALRRVLLSSVESVAITALYIQGITHEFSSIVGVRESVLELSLNFQSIVLCYDKRFFQKKDFFDDIQIGYLQVQGPKVVYANDLKLPLGVKVVDPTQYIATISREGVIVLKFTLGKITNSRLQSSSFHSTLPTTKQAISQQLLKRNIVKAKTRCSYKNNYAGNENIYCYPSRKRPDTFWATQLIGQPRSSYYQPLIFANSIGQSHGKRSAYTKKQTVSVKSSENGASTALAVKTVNKAKSFFNVNSYVQKQSVKRPFCKFKENGGVNGHRTSTLALQLSNLYSHPRNWESRFDHELWFVFGSPQRGLSFALAKPKQKHDFRTLSSCKAKLRAFGQRTTPCFCFAKALTEGRCTPCTLLLSPFPQRGKGLFAFAKQKQSARTSFALAKPSKGCKSKRAQMVPQKVLLKQNLAYKSTICNPPGGFAKAKLSPQRGLERGLGSKSKLCTCKKICVCLRQKGGKGDALRATHEHRHKLALACKQRKALGFAKRFVSAYKLGQKSDNSKFNYGFNKSVNPFRLKDNIFKSDICLHNIIPLDSSLSPVLKVNFLVEIDDEVLYLRQKVRERIILEVWTNGSIHPRQALHDATLSLLDIFSTFRSIYQTNQYSSTLLKVPEYNKR